MWLHFGSGGIRWWQKKWPKNGRIFMSSHPPKNAAKAAKRVASKTSARYWQEKVRLEKKPGWVSGSYYLRIQVRKERRKFVLKAKTKEEAGREALGMYLEALINGWPAAGPETPQSQEGGEVPGTPTIHDWMVLAAKVSTASAETQRKYEESLRSIVGESVGLPRARSKEARQSINAYPLSSLTKAMLQDWVDRRIEKLRGLDPVAIARGQNTIRTTIRNARGLFSESVREAIQDRFQMPVANVFEKLRMPKARHFGYTSRFSAEQLLKVASVSLGIAPGAKAVESEVSRFEQWKILYLGLVAGLRYNEIDKLRTQDVCGEKGRISIRIHEEFQPKATASTGDVLLSESARLVICGMLKHTKGKWFVGEARSNRNKAYRTGLHHDRLLEWLRNYEERGEFPLRSVPKPLHELRKEAGTIVNQNHGLNEAKSFLRHGSIATTATFYVGTKGGITTGLG